jgi:chondroitin 4-sulfotransferase 11
VTALLSTAKRVGAYYWREFELLLPESRRSQLIILRRQKLWADAGVIFIHVPKAAGTSISDEIYGRFVGHLAAKHVKRFAPGAFTALPSFTVVRNPFSRLLSAYRFATQGAVAGSGPVAGMFHPEIYQSPAFRSFDSFIEEWLPQQDLSKIDYVFRPQTHYVLDEAGAVLPDYVGRVEDMASVEAHLGKTLNKPVSIGRHNTTGKPDSYVAKYSPSMRNIVSGVYHADLEAFNYDF